MWTFRHCFMVLTSRECARSSFSISSGERPLQLQLLFPAPETRPGILEEEFSGEAARDDDEHREDGKPRDQRVEVDASVDEEHERADPAERLVAPEERLRGADLDQLPLTKRIDERDEQERRPDDAAVATHPRKLQSVETVVDEHRGRRGARGRAGERGGCA